VPLMVMIFYPIHQTYGQLAGGILLSMERTDIYRNISILSSALGIILCYFFIAPSTYLIPGLDLGATGLALKMVVVQIIGVNIIIYFVCRSLKKSFVSTLGWQIVPLIALFSTGYLSALVKSHIGFANAGLMGTLFSVFLFGVLYLCAAVMLCWMFPVLLGLKRGELVGYMNRFRTYVRDVLDRMR